MATARRRRVRSDADTTRPGKTGARTRGGSASRNAKKPQGSRFWRWTKRILGTLFILAMTALGAVAGMLWYYGRDLPDVNQLHEYHPPQVTRVVDREGEVLGESWQERRTVVPLDRVPRVLVLSVLAAEDADFYRHQGLDYPGLVRAVARGIVSGGNFRGTSTITQQVIKNLLLTSERSAERKIRELLLARQLEQEMTKDQILELYLNHVNFGHGRYGVQEAAQFYFGRDVEDLTLAEASLMAGIPQSPTHLSPRTHPEAARRRQLFVLRQLEEKRAEYWPDLSVEDIQAARDAEVEIVPMPERDHAAPEVLAYARRQLRALVGEEAADRGGYTIHTTLDHDLQVAARASLQHGLTALDGRQHLRVPLSAPRRRRPLPAVDELRVGGTYDGEVRSGDDETQTLLVDVGGHEVAARVEDLARYNPDELPASRIAEEGARVRVSIQQLGSEEDPRALGRLELGPQGAVVLIDVRSRDVLALVGGFDAEPGFDRATQAVRQPGSTFKPFVYGTGLVSRRYTPATIVIDAPGVYDDWRPSNYETWSFQGELRLREALAQSINQVAVRVIEDVTPEEVVGFARRLGIETPLEPTLALALGASEVRPIELVNAYATFPAGGRWEPWRLITRIEGPDGEVALPDREEPRDAMTPAEAYVLTSMMTSVVRTGTARRARQLRRPLAGKTGTSNEARDCWFVGFSAERVAGVWVGYDDRRPLGRRESGAASALPIWMELMETAHHGRAPTEFAVPSGVETVRIDPATGLLAYDGQENAIDEVFLEGTAPTEQAPSPDTVSPDEFLMEQLGDEEPSAEANEVTTEPLGEDT
ncbi:MAG: PBP1A family penicillin-binding protein [Myxococcales bacterium]|nr:PBP1A family penicillin-binding protein [Myxococcales bacterium]